MQILKNIIQANKQSRSKGIYSICSAHPLVIEAALRQGLKDRTSVLIEATANQVNQFGGYTDMRPADFLAFVYLIADKINFPRENIILGGDHLGPTCWTSESSKQAMEKSKQLIASYVAAGFKKIHLDTSMPCLDDRIPLAEEIIAERAALLCSVAEETAIKHFGQSDILYVIGTEVPPPGGAKEDIDTLEVTPAKNVEQTLDNHKRIFQQQNLIDAWSRVIAIVVQPGVEFDNFSVFPYQSEKAQSLTNFIKTIPNIVYEAHSTDYQPDQAYQALVQDHFAILKVGPQLTFALREALYALNTIEHELVVPEQCSKLKIICEKVMNEQPESWHKFYTENAFALPIYQHYSYSDRIRYYWPQAEIKLAVEKLLTNLSQINIPLSLLSQHMPCQYLAIINDELSAKPNELIIHKIMQVTTSYSQACQ